MCYCEKTVKSVATFELYELQQTNKFTDGTLQSKDGAVFSIHSIAMMSLSPEFREKMQEETHHCLPYSTEAISSGDSPPLWSWPTLAPPPPMRAFWRSSWRSPTTMASVS